MFNSIKKIVGRTRKIPILSTTYLDHTFYYPASSDIGRLVSEGHGWDGNIGLILAQLLPEHKPTLIEVGANIGATLMQMKLAKPDAEVHCFEPSNAFFDVLRLNIKTNHWSSVVANKVGLSNAPKKSTLYINNTTASVVTKEYDGHTFLFQQSIKLTTLDLYAQKMQKVDFIKIDTDGYDYTILQGAQATLSRLKPVLYVEFQISQIVKNGDRPVDFLNFLAGKGYRTFLLFNNYGQPLKLCTNVEDVLETYKQVRFMDILTVHESNADQVRSIEELYDKFMSGLLRPVVRQPIIRNVRGK